MSVFGGGAGTLGGCHANSLSVRSSITDKRRDEDYDEQVEETLQDEVNNPRTHDISTVAPCSATKKSRIPNTRHWLRFHDP